MSEEMEVEVALPKKDLFAVLRGGPLDGGRMKVADLEHAELYLVLRKKGTKTLARAVNKDNVQKQTSAVAMYQRTFALSETEAQFEFIYWAKKEEAK